MKIYITQLSSAFSALQLVLYLGYIFLDFKVQVCLSEHCENPGYHVTYRLVHIKDITNSYAKTYEGMKINIRPLSGTKLVIWHAGGRRQCRYIFGYREDYFFLYPVPLYPSKKK